MSKEGVLSVNTSGGAVIETLSGEGGPDTPPNGHNFNFSGSIAGGSATNGAIEFTTPGGPGHNENGQMDVNVLVDGTTIDINASNQLQVIGGVFSEEFTVDAHSPPGTNPVIPNGSGNVTITGGQVAAGTTANVIRTDSLAANTYTIQVQRAQAVASSTVGDNGVSHFNSANFTVDANGFVSLSGTGAGETITGDIGGALSPSSGNWNIITNVASNNSGATVEFSGSGSTLTLNVTDGIGNTLVGQHAGNATRSGGDNCAFGSNSLFSNQSGVYNNAFGYYSLHNCTGSSNNCYGYNSGLAITSGSNNSAFGHLSLPVTQTSAFNCAFGYNSMVVYANGTGYNSAFGQASLGELTTGSYNIAIGTQAGNNYTSSESNNICIGNAGATSESNAIHIGTQGTQTTCSIAGITGVTVSNQEYVTINSSTGQLGVTASGGSGIASISIQTFTSSGTYTPTSGMLYCTIECWGAGGGGGGAGSGQVAFYGAGGGGAGGYSRKTASAASIGASQTVTIGAAGSAGASGLNAGGNGGATSVGIICVANGGQGAAGGNYEQNNLGGAGGTPGTGDITGSGQPGGTGIGTVNASEFVGLSGFGGSSSIGGGGLSVTQINNGAAGTGYGSGGSGGLSQGNVGGQSGGAGTAGYIIITEYV